MRASITAAAASAAGMAAAASAIALLAAATVPTTAAFVVPTAVPLRRPLAPLQPSTTSSSRKRGTTAVVWGSSSSSSPEPPTEPPTQADEEQPLQPPSPLQQQQQQQQPQQQQRDVDMSAGLWPTESRQLLALLGALGCAETAFLSYQKLVVGDLTALCSLGGGGLSARCGDVLNSEYASFMGVPLTLPAMLAYGAVAALAARPLLLAEGTRERAEADVASRDPLLVRGVCVCVCVY